MSFIFILLNVFLLYRGKDIAKFLKLILFLLILYYVEQAEPPNSLGIGYLGL